MYKLVGADRQEYGPVSQESVFEWIAQGRANAQTIARFEDGPWKPLATFDEFKAALGMNQPIGTTTVISGPPPIGTTTEPLPFSGVMAQQKHNVPAIAGLITSFVCCCCGIGAGIGLVLSIIGFVQIRSHPNIYKTPLAIAIAGIVVSVIMLVLHILAKIFEHKLQPIIDQFPKTFGG